MGWVGRWGEERWRSEMEEPGGRKAVLFGVGGWVGGYRKKEENGAVRMRCCGWIDGWVVEWVRVT